MKRIIVFVCLLFSLSLKAQPAKVGGGLLPAFRMTKTTGRVFESRQLAGGRPVLLIYFAPDCDHCMVLLDAFFKKVADFKNAEIVLVTFKPVQDLLLIEKKYGTARLSNLHVGTEGLSFFLRNYYRMQKTPFVAVYDRQQKLVCSFRETTTLPEISACFKTIQ